MGAWANSLLAFGGEYQGDNTTEPLAAEELTPIVDAAIDIWAGTGLTTSQLEQLQASTVTIADLSGARLGAALGSSIVIDVNAAGYGWFVDPTPDQNEEFTDLGGHGLLGVAESAAAGRMDLLTVILHELGHMRGLDHDVARSSWMNGLLDVGTRRSSL